MKLSVRFKTLLTIITLSVSGLFAFAFLTFSTFKDDKLAFIYESVNSETTSRAQLFKTVSESQDNFLNMLISSADLRSEEGLMALKKIMTERQNKVNGLYINSLALNMTEQAVFEKNDLKKNWTWKALKEAPMGLSILDQEDGLFSFKKAVGTGDFAAITFHQHDLWEALDSSEGRFNLLVKDDAVFSRHELPGQSEFTALLAERVIQTPGPSGLFETKLWNEPYFIAFAKLGSDKHLMVHLVRARNVMQVQQTLMVQIVTFLVMMISFSLLVGTLAARALTVHLEELTEAAHEMENENFDVKVEIKSKDELGQLGSAFNHMALKIKKLLEELRIYNLELEEKVRIRTLELQQLTDIQTGMVNALGQGFVIVNKEHKILPVYSKVALEMFEQNPDQVEPHIIMGLEHDQAETYKDMFNMIFEGMMDFDSMTGLAPESRTNSKNQHIQLTYAPISNSQGDFEYVLVIGTDKTQEKQNMEKFQQQWSFSQMVMKVASNRFVLIKMLDESFRMLTQCQSIMSMNQPHAAREAQRLIHTVKGSFSYFHITSITQKCHELESYLEAFYNHQSLEDKVRMHVLTAIAAITEAIQSYLNQYEHIIHYKEQRTTKVVASRDLQMFSDRLKFQYPELKAAFDKSFFSSKVSPYFDMYPEMVKDLGSKLGKKLQFQLKGGETLVPDGPWEEVFQQFVHFVRNSADHGIETPEARINAGKSEAGTITFAFAIVGEQADMLHVSLRDDGAGVDWEKIAAKDPSIKCLEDALLRIQTGGITSKDEVSDISGRGVGVSALFSAVEKLGGYSKFRSEKGKGTEILIQIPMKLISSKANLKAA